MRDDETLLMGEGDKALVTVYDEENGIPFYKVYEGGDWKYHAIFAFYDDAKAYYNSILSKPMDKQQETELVKIGEISAADEQALDFILFELAGSKKIIVAKDREYPHTAYILEKVEKIKSSQD